MSKQIDIRFFELGNPTIKEGVLIIEEFGKNMIDFRGDFLDPFRVIDVIFADAIDSEEQYTLVNCVFNHSVGANCRFIINELYQGTHLAKVTTEDCLRATGRVTGLTGWINQSRI